MPSKPERKFAVVVWRDMDEIEHPEEGYVVRTAYLQSDGSYWIPRPYGKAIPVRLYTRDNAAQDFCDKLNDARARDKTPNELAKANEGSLAKPW